jgi:hypothetical protein
MKDHVVSKDEEYSFCFWQRHRPIIGDTGLNRAWIEFASLSKGMEKAHRSLNGLVFVGSRSGRGRKCFGLHEW